MNAITNFRKCTLTNEELMQMVDQQTDAIFTLGKIPTRHIPARPNKDYDLLVGELILRFKELTEQSQLHAIMQVEGSEETRRKFCLWYYAQSQPLDANKVFEWFRADGQSGSGGLYCVSSDSLVHGKSCDKWCGDKNCWRGEAPSEGVLH